MSPATSANKSKSLKRMIDSPLYQTDTFDSRERSSRDRQLRRQNRQFDRFFTGVIQLAPPASGPARANPYTSPSATGEEVGSSLPPEGSVVIPRRANSPRDAGA